LLDRAENTAAAEREADGIARLISADAEADAKEVVRHK
jgi:hypothetical protein